MPHALRVNFENIGHTTKNTIVNCYISPIMFNYSQLEQFKKQSAGAQRN